MNEPKVILATVRDSDDDLSIECRFSDGQKFSAIKVDGDFPQLASMIAEFLNSKNYEHEILDDKEKQTLAWKLIEARGSTAQDVGYAFEIVDEFHRVCEERERKIKDQNNE